MMGPTEEARAEQEEQRLSPEQVGSLAGFGRRRRLREGEYLFGEKDVVDSFFVVVEGEVGISRLDGGEETRLLTHGPGEFTGGLAVLTGKTSIHRARALSPTVVVEIDSETFRRVALERPGVADAFVSGLARRMRITQRAFRRHEKLAALGKLSAGLAHELGNPAAAARRASQELRTAVVEAQGAALAHDARFSDEGRKALAALRRTLEARPAPTLDPLAVGDAEDALALWLEDHGVDGGWDLAPVLVAGGATGDDLQGLARSLRGDALTGAVSWLATTLGLVGLAEEVSASAGRISDLVGAVKGYTYMDRAGPAGVDVVEGLEATVGVMGHKLRGIVLKRDFEDGLPSVPGHGGELNQVWANLIDNAADAVEDGGEISLRAHREGETVVVEVADDGPGIPPETRSRVFEPFFTTKPVGSGTGLGLDVVRRTVAGHGGTVEMRTGPEGTRFRVRLPLEGGIQNGG